MLRALAAVAAALVVCAPVLAKGGPTIRMTVAAPATVQGAGFHPREVVRLVLSAGGKSQAHRLLTTPTGRFSSVWKTVSVDLCGTWRLTATGNKGSRVVVHSRADACPAPPTIE